MISNIKLTNFRKFQKLDLDINGQFVIINGENALGKTSILESIYFASITKSIRTSNLKDLIKDDNEFSLVELTNENKYKISLTNQGKQIWINNNPVKKISDYVGLLPTIFFTPSELELITSGPIRRRQFLNIEISQINDRYLNLLSNYNSLLKERNTYLKVSEKIDRTYLEIITNNLSSVGLEIIKIRIKFIEELNMIINDVHKFFSNKEVVKLKYNTPDIDNYENYMLSKMDYDIKTRNTNFGPHRDDVTFYINENDAKVYASQGQKRSIVLSLKISLCHLIKTHLNKYPVLLLDDVLSELDLNRQNELLKIVFNLGQTFISVTNVCNIDLSVLQKYQIINLERGVEE